MAGRSRMNREVHVRICGGLEVRFLRSTRLSILHDWGRYPMSLIIRAPLTVAEALKEEEDEGCQRMKHQLD
jgi:hypothetical protein